jgi:twinkle protein
MESYEESEVIEQHLPCSSCGSSDALCLYSDSHTFCYSCRKYTFGDQQKGERSKMASNRKPKPPIERESLILEPLKARGITKETCQKYSYYKSKVDGKDVQVACYIKDGEVQGQKIRWANKDFRIFGNIDEVFFGQHLFLGGGKKLIVCEGEIDCLTVSQIQGNKYPVVSIPKGAGSAKKTFKAQLEWLELFDEIIVIFDMDVAGREAVQSIKGIVSPGKLKIAELSLKDPNAMLLAGKVEELTRSIWNAEVYRPEGIVNGSSLYNKIRDLKNKSQGKNLPWDIPLNRMIRGVRSAEITLVTAGSGIGKTTMIRAIAHNLGSKQDTKVGCLFLEEPPERTAQGLMSIEAQTPLHLNEDSLTDEEYKAIFEKTLGTGNFVFYDHFGSLEGNTLVNQMRYMAISEECKFLILDHISIAISGLEGENERRIIDKLMTDLAVLTQETGVGIIVISHLRKTDGKGKSHEEGGKVSLDDLRGSGALKQLSFTVIALERNQQDEDPRMKNVVNVKVLKCRYTGETGYAGYLYYNKETDCLEAVQDLDAFLGRESTEENSGEEVGF